MHFKLVTPDRTLIDEEVFAVSLPTPDGEVTILPHHVPLASLVIPGVVKLKRDGGLEELAVSGGFVHVTKEGEVSLLADTAEHAHELKMDVIEQAKQRARDVMRQAVRQDDVSFAAAAAALERELARYRVATKHHKKTPHERF